eukprot:scaffold7382_cov406-Prasinococcus_capsulatus_cf.AAC.35
MHIVPSLGVRTEFSYFQAWLSTGTMGQNSDLPRSPFKKAWASIAFLPPGCTLTSSKRLPSKQRSFIFFVPSTSIAMASVPFCRSTGCGMVELPPSSTRLSSTFRLVISSDPDSPSLRHTSIRVDGQPTKARTLLCKLLAVCCGSRRPSSNVSLAVCVTASSSCGLA